MLHCDGREYGTVKMLFPMKQLEGLSVTTLLQSMR
jgi:hypothetical protein